MGKYQGDYQINWKLWEPGSETCRKPEKAGRWEHGQGQTMPHNQTRCYGWGHDALETGPGTVSSLVKKDQLADHGPSAPPKLLGCGRTGVWLFWLLQLKSGACLSPRLTWEGSSSIWLGAGRGYKSHLLPSSSHDVAECTLFYKYWNSWSN